MHDVLERWFLICSDSEASHSTRTTRLTDVRTRSWSVGPNGDLDVNTIGNNVWSTFSVDACAADDSEFLGSYFFGDERL